MGRTIVNAHLPFPVQSVLDSLICLNGTRFEKSTDRGFVYYQAKFTQHVVKIYDKGRQINSDENVLRVEIKVLRMQYFRDRGININHLADLVDSKHHSALGKILIETVDRIMFDERTLKYSELAYEQKELYLAGRCPKHWVPIRRGDFATVKEYNRCRTKRLREERRFRLLVDTHRSQPNWRISMVALVREKWNALTTLPTDWPDLHRVFIERWHSMADTANSTANLPTASDINNVTNLPTASANSVANLPTTSDADLSQIYPLNVKEVCNNCSSSAPFIQYTDNTEKEGGKRGGFLLSFSLPSRELTNGINGWLQDGRYISASILKRNPDLLAALKGQFKQYRCGSKEDEASRVAHNERNHYFNSANNLKRRLQRSIASTSLFTPSDVIRLTEEHKKQLARLGDVANEWLNK